MKDKSILLVEDNLIIRKVVVGLLAKHGHRIDQAENGRVALDMLAVQDYDLVLMDVQMPEMDGLEATRRIRELERGTGRHLAVVGLTALAMLGDREACLEAGMDECVYKPIDVLMLLQAIEGAGSRSAAPEVETASLSVPQLVKMISFGVQPSSAATFSRASLRWPSTNLPKL